MVVFVINADAPVLSGRCGRGNQNHASVVHVMLPPGSHTGSDEVEVI